MKYRILLILLVGWVGLFGQKGADGEAFFNNKQYSKAKSIYEVLLKKRPNDLLANYRFARCCYELKEYESSIHGFEVSASKFPLAHYYLGEIYFETYRFDQAQQAFQALIATTKLDDVHLVEYQKKLALAEKAAKMLTKVDDILIVDSICVSKADFLRFYKISSELGKLDQNLLRIKGGKRSDKITYTTQRGDRVIFSDTINGQSDILTSFKLLDEWSQPVSISDAINTPANENYPFLLLDGVTIYFASDGENSLGGYDIFVSRYNSTNNSYLAPENVGFPYNSTANDYMMVIDDLHKVGWFATDRRQPLGKVMIYTFIPNDQTNIVRAEDAEFLRKSAQLLTYRKQAKSVNKSDVITDKSIVKSSTQMTDNQIYFIVNDSLIYLQASDFQSSEARRFWNEYEMLSVDLKVQSTELDELRSKFGTIDDVEQRKIISKKIVELELKIPQLKKDIEQKLLKVRNEENRFLQTIVR